MKKILLMFMVLVMVVTTVACGNDTSTPDNSNNEATQHTFYYATYSDPILQWDPSGSVSNEVMVFNNIYETLLGYNPTEDEFEYKLATDYSVSEDGLIWTFNLREGVKFTDGSDFNADVGADRLPGGRRTILVLYLPSEPHALPVYHSALCPAWGVYSGPHRPRDGKTHRS